MKQLTVEERIDADETLTQEERETMKLIVTVMEQMTKEAEKAAELGPIGSRRTDRAIKH